MNTINSDHVNSILDQEKLKETLVCIFKQTHHIIEKYEYRLVGTSAALLRGVKLPAGDIDILVKERQAVDAISAALSSWDCVQPPEYLEKSRQYYSEFRVNGIELGISTVEWETEYDGIECIGPGPWEHFDKIKCGQFAVQTVSLELRLVSELIRERPERYDPLIQYMKKKGVDLDLFRQGMAARGMPDERQEEVIQQLSQRRLLK
ncbi:MAG: hypothetical protein JEZ06_03500 [Anaerolineaceae bacterium]|nr:hypothetical protein [Anaerolineaceae bacterium]